MTNKGINIENDNRQVVIYARVSTRNQKDDLQNQVAFLRQFCNAKGIIVDQCIEDYGSGLNYNRKNWFEKFCINSILILLWLIMKNYRHKKNSYKILYLYCIYFLVDYMDFVSIKKTNKGG